MMEHNTVVKTQSNKSYIAKLDITQIAFDNHLTVDLGMVGSLHRLSYPPFKQKLLYSAATFNPTFPETKNSAGEYDQVTEAIWISNPLSLLDMTQDEDNGHFNVHLKGKVILSKNLTLRVFGSYSFNNIDDAHYYPTSVWNRGQAYRQHEKTEDMLGNISLTYILNLSHSTLNVMALAEAENTKKKGFYVTSTGFNTDAFGYDKLSAGVARPWDGTDSYYADSHMESLLMRATYTLLNRYTLTVNARGELGFLPLSQWCLGHQQGALDEEAEIHQQCQVAYRLWTVGKPGWHRLLQLHAAHTAQRCRACRRCTSRNPRHRA